jgi:hypothetical protein
MERNDPSSSLEVRFPLSPLPTPSHLTATSAPTLATMSSEPKSILKKRARPSAVDPAVEEAPVVAGQQPSDAPLQIPSSEEDDSDDDEEGFSGSEDEFSAGSGDDLSDEDAIREMNDDGQERPAKSASFCFSFTL